MNKKERKALSMVVLEAIYTIQYAVSSTSAYDSGSKDLAWSHAKISDKHFNKTKQALKYFIKH